ncbi:MAG TPA: hypothetical protein VM029_15645, partial [Opitutaceae bacterium]|nr:hypothetical protein [Opitutaceae bacterium]
AATPNNSRPYLHKAMLLACLGEKVAGNEALRTYEQLTGITYSSERPMTAELATIYVRLGRFDEVFTFPPAPEVARMRIDPRFDALRADPRFAKWAVSGVRLEAKPSL